MEAVGLPSVADKSLASILLPRKEKPALRSNALPEAQQTNLSKAREQPMSGGTVAPKQGIPVGGRRRLVLQQVELFRRPDDVSLWVPKKGESITRKPGGQIANWRGPV